MTFGEFILDNNATRVAPVLPSRDLAAAARFYERLGFAVTLIEGHGGYLIIRKDWVELHFFPFPELDPLTNANGAYIRLTDVDAAVAGIGGTVPASGTPRFHPPVDRAWGLREAYLIDPDGNLIKIGAPINPDYPVKTASPPPAQGE